MAVDGALESRKKFRLTEAAERDLNNRISHAIGILRLPETTDELLQRFLAYDVPNKFIAAERAFRKAVRRRKEIANAKS